MDRESAEKTGRFLTLFGLDENFTPGELASSYRALARLNHPDVAHDVASEMRMVIINEGYEFLKKAHPRLRGKSASPGRSVRREDGPAAAVYRQYRKAFGLLRTAFDDYFARPDIEILKKRLAAAKDEFARVINDFPYSEWVDDAIDRIHSINRWVGGEKNT